MATILNQLTRLHDLEGALTTGNIPVGGVAAAANTDIFIQGSQSLAQRQIITGVTPAGFSVVDTIDNNISAAGSHIGMWIWVTHYQILNVITGIIGSGTTPSDNYNGYDIPLDEYPSLGGWLRFWVDPTAVASRSAGTVTTSLIRHVGVACAFSSVPGGVAPNLVLDACDYTNGGAALQLTGTTGAFSDFSTADENTSNQYGVFRAINGVYYCFARIQLGTASSLEFNDNDFTIIFPQQSWVSDTFMGVTVDLQNAATDIKLLSGAISSAGAKRGDFQVTGTAGILVLNNLNINRLRTLTFTSSVSVSDSVFSGCGQIIQDGASIVDCNILNSSATSAILSNNPTVISRSMFQSSGVGHAIEITAAGTYTFDGNLFYGYTASDGATGNEAVYNNSGGSVTLNVIGGGDIPSIRNGVGATTTIINVCEIPTVQDIANGVWAAALSAYTNGSAGATVSTILNTTVDNRTRSDQIKIVVDNLLILVDEVLKYDRNRTRIDKVTKTLTVYDDDGITPIRIFNLLDSLGNQNIDEVFERDPGPYAPPAPSTPIIFDDVFGPEFE